MSMKRMANKTLIWTLILMLVAACSPLNALAVAVNGDSASNKKDDFYAAVNADWLASAEIAPDRYSTGGFDDLAYEILDLLMADSDKMRTGEIQPDSEMLRQYVAYYTLCADYEKRDADGAEPLKPYLARVEALDSLDALNQSLDDWLLTGVPLPFNLGVSTDLGNAQQYALYISAPPLLLPDVSYYDASNPYGPMLLDAVAGVSNQLLILAGYSEEDAARITEEAIAFDALLVPHAMTAEERSDIKNSYNPTGLNAFCAARKNIDFGGLVDALVTEAPEQIIVTTPKYFEAFDEIVFEQNFPLMKSWMIFQTVYSCSGYLTEPMQTLANSVSNMLLGQAEPTSKERLAYSVASSVFGPVVGDYYGRRYFGEEAKADVTQMVKNLIGVYRQRLQNNTWLSEDTKQAALRKLDTMSIQVGYPDHIDPLYEKLVVTPASEGGTLLGNTMDFTRVAMEDMFSKLGTPVDRDKWTLSASTVNAMYSFQNNAIMFPAAILQEPFYSLDQSASANYGGIGAVIAHEISHAFDPNGALFDEYGSMANWWTDEDMAQFEKLAQDMVTLFDGQPYGGGLVNGTLTKAENIADAGGLSCALEVVKSLPDADFDAFFTSWAVIWRVRYTPEVEQYLLTIDSHAPNKLRCNLQLPLLEEYYDTYEIEEGDGMYIAPENRLSIW